MQSAILIDPYEESVTQTRIHLNKSTEGHENDTNVSEGEELGTKRSVCLRFTTVN
jgi:hypothetical protein